MQLLCLVSSTKSLKLTRDVAVYMILTRDVAYVLDAHADVAYVLDTHAGCSLCTLAPFRSEHTVVCCMVSFL